MHMKRWTMPVAAMAMLAVAACGQRPGEADVSENPVPTAGSHQPDNPSPYGTGAQETRSNEEAKAADAPNDDGDGVEEADEPPRR